MKRISLSLLCAIVVLALSANPCAAQGTGVWPELSNSTGGILIERLSKAKQWLSDFLIISKSGTLVVVDPFATPEELMRDMKPDIIAVSHAQHYEHIDPALIEKFKDDPNVAISVQKAGEFSKKDVVVRSVGSAHNPYGYFPPLNPPNVIYSFEMDGVRIVNFGGMGQKELEADQAAALGRVDVAMVPFGQYKDAIVSLMKQVKPKLIIVTHRMASVSLPEVAESLGTELEIVKNKLVLDPESVLKGNLRFVDLTNELY